MDAELEAFVEKSTSGIEGNELIALKRAQAEALFYRMKYDAEKQKSDLERKLRKQCEISLQLLKEKDSRRQSSTIQIILLKQLMDVELMRFVNYHYEKAESYFAERPSCQTFRTKLRSSNDKSKIPRDELLLHWVDCPHTHLSDRNIYDTIAEKDRSTTKNRSSIKESIPKLYSKIQTLVHQTAANEDKTVLIPRSAFTEIELLAAATFFSRHHYVCVYGDGLEVRISGSN
eukprot:TRINITY_DN11005_c0_g1_i3.p1 TRINITY_DN11005_c0_g1~~TRINITY_DN11005_c0_g1_i3.p1  ORF type:complete len:231 (+),score=46.89 TRINITY_DN11005_c0_g1_i3:51-743(+)